MAFGRVEARYTLTSAWTVSATNTSEAAPVVCTVAAGNYYATALCTALQTAMNASMGAPDFTVSVANAEGGTGLVSISAASGNWSLTWGSTDFRDALGFTGNIGSVSSTQTGTNSLKGLWLPDSPLTLPTDDDTGFYHSDLRQTVGPTGEVYSLAGNTRREWQNCYWTHVSKDRVLGTAASPMTWKQFLLETQFGTVSYFPAGARVAIYSNATLSTLLGYYHMLGLPTTTAEQAFSGWAGRWKVTIPRLVYQSS